MPLARAALTAGKIPTSAANIPTLNKMFAIFLIPHSPTEKIPALRHIET
jgi:hypothetical protein